jgi:putative transposase
MARGARPRWEGETTGPNPTDRAQGGVKRRLVTEGHDVPLRLVVESANWHAMTRARSTRANLVVTRPEPTAAHPQGLGLHKGDDEQEGRDILAEFGVTAHTRARGEEAQAITEPAAQRARRWVVGRPHSWMNPFRRILVRGDKTPEHYLAFLHVACALITCRAAGLFG